jgi:TDG/mug DNA glycosylase family protein
MSPLRDVLTSHPKVVFVGINPSLRSEAVGHHFAGPGNPFWRLLYAAGLTPEPLTYADDARLAELGMAMTNLCPRATRSASELERDELERGRRVLLQKIRRLRAELIVLVGVTLYQQLLGTTRRGTPGPGLKPDHIDGARIFVLPNPSGLNASFPSFAAKLRWFKRLRRLLAASAEGGSATTRQLAPSSSAEAPRKSQHRV